MEQLKTIKEQIIAEVVRQLGNLKEVNTKELGEAIDMIKDLAEASYYCTIEEAMHKSDDDKQYRNNNYYYMERYYPSEDSNEFYLHDEREGRSPIHRKMYMESKETHQDQSKVMKELESYMQELMQDMMDMIDKASPEEKSIIQKKINTLSTKVQNM